MKLIWRHLPKHKRFHAKKTQAKTFSKLNKVQTNLYIINILLEMIAANREVDKDWSEFESYATNLYARSLLTSQPLSAAVLAPSKVRQEQQSSSDPTSNSPQSQSSTGSLDIKAMTDEMMSVKKAILDLRTYSEEVN
jgi:hypothetical protein